MKYSNVHSIYYSNSGGTFDVPYDYLCIAGGKKSNTFGVKK
jgi:NADH dehydrogenase FAD-containing subunit